LRGDVSRLVEEPAAQLVGIGAADVGIALRREFQQTFATRAVEWVLGVVQTGPTQRADLVEQRDDVERRVVHASQPCTNAATTAASSGPRSSCRKWPPPSIVVWCWPSAPGTSCWNTRSPPRVIASSSENAVRNGRLYARSVSHAARFAADAGSSGFV